MTVTLLATAIFVAGCNKAPTAAQQVDKIEADTKQVAQDLKDYKFTQKSEFVAEMQGQLDGINKDLDVLAAKIEKSSDAAKANAKPKYEALRAQSAKLSKQLDEARNATESTWGDIKNGTRKAFNEVKEGFQQSRQWLSDKIAP